MNITSSKQQSSTNLPSFLKFKVKLAPTTSKHKETPISLIPMKCSTLIINSNNQNSHPNITNESITNLKQDVNTTKES